jgi:hypothetical protein
LFFFKLFHHLDFHYFGDAEIEQLFSILKIIKMPVNGIKSKFLPKLILRYGGKSSLIPWTNVDWHPAKEPNIYDI